MTTRVLYGAPLAVPVTKSSVVVYLKCARSSPAGSDIRAGNISPGAPIGVEILAIGATTGAAGSVAGAWPCRPGAGPCPRTGSGACALITPATSAASSTPSGRPACRCRNIMPHRIDRGGLLTIRPEEYADEGAYEGSLGRVFHPADCGGGPGLDHQRTAGTAAARGHAASRGPAAACRYFHDQEFLPGSS